MRRLLVCVVLLVTACKKGSKSEEPTPGSGTATTGSAVTSGSSAVSVDAPVAEPAGSGSGSAASATLPKEIAELEATLVALINEPESDARSKKTCGQLMEIQKKARAVKMNKPASIDQAAWDAAYKEIADSIAGMGPPCGDDPPDDSIELPKLYKAFQALVALLPK